MMEKVRKRGEAIAEQRLARAKSVIRTALAEESPGDVRITETVEGVQLEARRLKQRLAGSSSLRDIAFLMRTVL